MKSTPEEIAVFESDFNELMSRVPESYKSLFSGIIMWDHGNEENLRKSFPTNLGFTSLLSDNIYNEYLFILNKLRGTIY
ncbi:MAG: hypothetical protein WC716_16230 [Chitinophagaceae bacterium]|jgi:hypothetical protein